MVFSTLFLSNDGNSSQVRVVPRFHQGKARVLKCLARGHSTKRKKTGSASETRTQNLQAMGTKPYSCATLDLRQIYPRFSQYSKKSSAVIFSGEAEKKEDKEFKESKENKRLPTSKD